MRLVERRSRLGRCQGLQRRPLVAVMTAIVLPAFGTSAHALDLSPGGDVKVRWDNTFKYSSSWRVKDRSTTLTGNPNQDDGDRNFDKGQVSSRVDWLSELDLTYQNLGARISGAAWYDDIYNRGNDNNSAATANALSVANDRFPATTKDLHGRKGELLDAFVFGNFDVAEGSSLNLRLGRHTVVYGESLFFGANGIANGQSAVDYVKLLSVPNTQFKELLRPVNQLSGQLQVNSQLSLGAYYQFRWEKNRIPASGSYFNTVDFIGDGSERILFGPPLAPGLPAAAFFHGDDIKAKNSGQGGIQVRYRPEGSDTDYGFYAVRYHDKMPLVYIKPGVDPSAGTPIPGGVFNPLIGQIGQYGYAYAESVRALGASFSTVLGTTNVAGEFSVRYNAPLVSDAAQVMPWLSVDGDANNPFAIGKTGHAQISWIHAFGNSGLWDDASWLGEVAWNRLLSISKNAVTLDPNTTRDAWGFRMVFEPTYYQVLPGLDISIPIGLGYNPKGRSSTVANFNGGVNEGGDLSIGIKGDYQKRVKFSVNYTHYLGSEGNTLDAANALSFKQALKDRDFLSCNVTYSF